MEFNSDFFHFFIGKSFLEDQPVEQILVGYDCPEELLHCAAVQPLRIAGWLTPVTRRKLETINFFGRDLKVNMLLLDLCYFNYRTRV